jgi:small subunit ribosomal protein S7
MTSDILTKTKVANALQILERDGDEDKAPEIIKDEINDKSAAENVSFENLLALGQIQNISTGGHATDPVDFGHKFGLPELPIPPNSNLKYRYDPIIVQVTNLIMKDGKKSVAQRVGSSVSLSFPSALHYGADVPRRNLY